MHHTMIRSSDALALAVLHTLREEGLSDADVLGEAPLAAMGLYDSLPRERGSDIGRAVVQCHRFARRAEVARGRIVGDEWLGEGTKRPRTMLTLYARTASGWETTWERCITGDDWDDFLARAM